MEHKYEIVLSNCVRPKYASTIEEEEIPTNYGVNTGEDYRLS